MRSVFAELLLDAVAQRVEPLARRADDEHRVRMAERRAPRGARRRSASALLRTSTRGRSPAPISSSTSSTALIISSISSSRRGCVDDVEDRGRPARVSSSVAPNASTSWWGSLRMKPTVSVSEVRAVVQPRERVVGSSVWNRRSRTLTLFSPVRAFSSVDLPAFV